MSERLCIIANARSGTEAAAQISTIIDPLRARWPEPEIRLVRNGKDIATVAREAREAGFSTVIAAGGDGTICGVASELIGSDVNLGVIPMGTFNFFARSLGLPMEPADAVKMLTSGVPTPIQVGEVNGRFFLNNASIGLYPAILQDRENLYKQFGRSQLAAYFSVLRTISTAYRPSRMRVTVDGEMRRLRSPMIFVANSAYQLEEYGLDGADLIRDGKLAILVAPDVSRFQLVGFALRLIFRSARRSRDFELIAGHQLVIETTRKRRTIARDGEHEKLSSPFHFKLHQDALKVLLPVAQEKAA